MPTIKSVSQQQVVEPGRPTEIIITLNIVISTSDNDKQPEQQQPITIIEDKQPEQQNEPEVPDELFKTGDFIAGFGKEEGEKGGNRT